MPDPTTSSNASTSTSSNVTNAILLLSLPARTFVGINLSTFSSSPNFRGIAHLPHGLHFLYTGTDASLSIRHGYWLKLSSKSPSEGCIYVLKWRAEDEHLELLRPDSSEAQNAIRSVLTAGPSRGLVDYTALREASVKLNNEQAKSASPSRGAGTDNDEEDDDEASDDSDPWIGLASHISPRLLDRILVTSTKQSKDSSTFWTLTSISSAPGDTENIPGLTPVEANNVLTPTQTLNFLPVDLKKTWNEKDIGSVRTQRARDRSWYLTHLLSTLQKRGSAPEVTRQVAARELLGEVQFAFLMVLCLANYSSLEQWKRLLSVFLTCQTALVEIEGYFVEIVSVLRRQLGRVEDVEGGLFEMTDEVGSAWLRRLLKSFRGNVDEVWGETGEGGVELRKSLQELEKWLSERYGWEDERHTLRRGMLQLEDGEMVELQTDGLDEDEETGEYAPVVVEM